MSDVVGRLSPRGSKGGWAMLVRGCAGAGGELRHSLAERTKALAAKCHALRSPALPRESRSADRRRVKGRKSQTRWYVKVSWVPGPATTYYLGTYYILYTVSFLSSYRSKTVKVPNAYDPLLKNKKNLNN